MLGSVIHILIKMNIYKHPFLYCHMLIAVCPTALDLRTFRSFFIVVYNKTEMKYTAQK